MKKSDAEKAVANGERDMDDLSPEGQVRYAVSAGADRISKITNVTSISDEWTVDVVSELVRDNVLVQQSDSKGTYYRLASEMEDSMSEDSEPDTDDADRKESITERPGDDTVSGPEADEEDVAETRRKHDGTIPVDRDYNWEAEKLDPDSVADYVDSNGEYGDIKAEIEDRELIDKLPRHRIPGPTGCGKTTCGEALAVEADGPAFIIECHDGLRPNNLLGMPTYVGDETWWTDGPVTKALLASEAANRDDTDFDEVFLIFDEVNRTTSRTLGVVMSALDHRGEVTLNARGGETVKGDPMNLVVIATMNSGDGYIVNPIDRAQKRRFGNTYPVDYIGMNDIDAEIGLLTKETPVGENTADAMVRAANEIRKKADEDGSPVEMGVPTSTMLDWAKTAKSYADRDRDADGGPLMKAARRAVLNTFFADDERERDVVQTTLESHVRGMDVEGPDDTESESESDDAESLSDLFGDPEDTDDSDSASISGEIDASDETFLMCGGCGHYEEVAEADEEVVATMECPECGDPLDPVESR